jgi:dihydroxyacetone kinase
MDVRMVAVTDDIASGSVDERLTRRGIAGSFLVAKIVCAAAEEGQPLDTVERLAIAANEATRSFGVAFSGCTLPGADGPLFSIPAGRMAVGLGIHGEPGIAEVPLGSCDDVADVLVDGLFEERPPVQGQRIGVLVNGLGGTSPDELHLVFARVRSRLETAGMVLVAPVVSDLVTSLDMAGVSLSLTYFDKESERLWLAATDSPYFTRGMLAARPLRELPVSLADGQDEQVSKASAVSQQAASIVVRCAERVRNLLRDEEPALGAIDAVAGDGDHGACMARGSAAAAAAAHSVAERGGGAGTALTRAGEAWSDAAGGASGALWGAGLVAAGRVVKDEEMPSAATVANAARAFQDVILSRGGAQVGDKTMVDAVVPFVAALERVTGSGDPLLIAWQAAADEATTAAGETANIVARMGRARTHGVRSLGTPDAGAVSFALVVSAIGPDFNSGPNSQSS